MTSDLKIATENLYRTFSKYPFKSKIKGCPCCIAGFEKTTIHTKQLRDLEDDDISTYAFKAMTTWGDINDFKHYLPRIFELASTRNLIVDSFVVLGKLDFSEWQEWDAQEQQTIKNFLKAWWQYDINNADCFDAEILIELYKLIEDLPSMLEDWNVEIETQGFKNFVEFVEFEFNQLQNCANTYKEIDQEFVRYFCSWIESKRGILEEAFFKYDKIDKEFSERISNSLYIVERIN